MLGKIGDSPVGIYHFDTLLSLALLAVVALGDSNARQPPLLHVALTALLTRVINGAVIEASFYGNRQHLPVVWNSLLSNLE